MLLILSLIMIILVWAWLDKFLAGFISAVIFVLWVIFEGDKQKGENRTKF